MNGNGNKVRANLTLSEDAFEQLKKLVPSVSAEVDTFIKRRVAELQGGEPEQDYATRYKNLYSHFQKLLVDTVKLERTLRAFDCFEEATELLLSLGLKKDFSNTDLIVPKFVDAWKGDEAFLHQYLTLVELARDKARAEEALTLMRRGSAKPVEKPVREVAAIVAWDDRPTFFLHDKKEVQH